MYIRVSTTPAPLGHHPVGTATISVSDAAGIPAPVNRTAEESFSSGTSIPAPQKRENPVRIPLLYVDDDPDQLFIGKTFLEKMGDFRVDTTDSPKAALEMIQRYRYSVIVSDYQMPEMNGVEFFTEAGKKYTDLPFVLFTARDWKEVSYPGLNELIDGYVQKCGTARAQYTALGRSIQKAVTSHRQQKARPGPTETNP